jgi:hypothetical protein
MMRATTLLKPSPTTSFGQIHRALQMVFDAGFMVQSLGIGIRAVLNLIPNKAGIAFLIFDLALNVVAVERRTYRLLHVSATRPL